MVYMIIWDGKDCIEVQAEHHVSLENVLYAYGINKGIVVFESDSYAETHKVMRYLYANADKLTYTELKEASQVLGIAIGGILNV